MRTSLFVSLCFLLSYNAYSQQNNCQSYTALLPQLETVESNLMYSLNNSEQRRQSDYFKQLSRNAVSHLSACNNTVNPNQLQRKLTNYYLLGKHAEDGELFTQSESFYLKCVQDNRSRNLYYKGQVIYQLALSGLERVENANAGYMANKKPVYNTRTTTQPYQPKKSVNTQNRQQQTGQVLVNNQYQYQGPSLVQNKKNYYDPHTGQYSNTYTGINGIRETTVSNRYNAPHPNTYTTNNQQYNNRRIVVTPPRQQQQLVSNRYNAPTVYQPQRQIVRQPTVVVPKQQLVRNQYTVRPTQQQQYQGSTQTAYISAGVIGRISPITDSYPEIFQTNKGYQVIVEGNLNAVKSMSCSLPGAVFNPAVISSSNRRDKFVLNINKGANLRDFPVTVTLKMTDNTEKTYSYVLR